MRRLLIQPLDVLMFRSERPFISVESHVAKLGIISPLTFEGALKSKIFSESLNGDYTFGDFQRKKKENEKEFKERIKEIIKGDKKLKKTLNVIGHPAVTSESLIQVFGVFLFKGTEWLPAPNDIVKIKEKNEISKLNPIIKKEFKIPREEIYACFSNHSKIESISGLISFDNIKMYLKGAKPRNSWIKDEQPYLKEPRTGIKIKEGIKRSKEGYLYSAEFLRLKEGWSFSIWYQSPVEVPEGIIKLGGENRGATSTKIEDKELSGVFKKIVEEINRDGKFKIYLATPSYFGGYKPPKDMLMEILGVDHLKLVSALPGKPIYIGGYDFARNKEKPLKRWVNSGAVYYYKFEGKIQNIELPLKLIEEDIEMRCAFIGRW
ncbi:MAG: type III-B CRISPR module-associated protein Cmr3 [Methanobacteriales archaeon]